MTILFDGTLLDAVAAGSTPVTGNSGPFSSVVQTSGSVLASTTQAYGGSGRSMRHLFSGAGSACHALTAAATPAANYETIVHTFNVYIDVISSAATIQNCILLSSRYAIYLFNSSGWKVGFTLLHNSSGVKIATEATSAAMTTGAWHRVTAIYKKLSATNVDLLLYVDGVLTSALNQSHANLTVVSGSGNWRVGPASQMVFAVSATSGDSIYLDNINITSDAASAVTAASRATMYGRFASMGVL